MAEEAAEAMAITSARLLQLKLIDQVIPEPLGGAHRDPDTTAVRLKTALNEALALADSVTIDQVVEARFQRLMRFGRYQQS